MYFSIYCWGNGIIPELSLSVFEQNNVIAIADYVTDAYQLDFQDSASFLMESIVDLHNYIMFYLCVVLVLVSWVLFAVCFFNSTSKTGQGFNTFLNFINSFKNRETVRKDMYFLAKKERDTAFRYRS